MESVEKAVAKSLMDIKAVMLRPDQPFVWASGWHSPIYCDNRRILSFPEIRENVCTWMADIIRRQYPDVEVIAGVATGAIAHGYLVAHIHKSHVELIWSLGHDCSFAAVAYHVTFPR